MQEIQGIKAKDIAKYALLPGIIPRINAFIESGFGWLAFMMAVIYNGVRLLPNDHAYLNPRNMGKYGIRHVIAEAANNLVIKKENIDQVIIFFALLIGFVLLILQCAGLALGILVKPAAAGGLAAFAGLFTTPECVNPGAQCLDIAHMLLDKVFGVPEIFNSKFAPAGTGFGAIPVFNRALQELFQYYSYAILIVGIVIFLYYILLVVGETANTGTPFGRRFNHIYAPLRLVAAIGLLVPLNYGLNSAQYITLLAAKFGSGFATNSWIIFNNELAAADTPVGTHNETLIARPKPADITHIVAYMSVVQTCKEAYRVSYPTPPNVRDVRGWLVKNENGNTFAEEMDDAYDYADALAFYNSRDITIVFGHRFPDATDKNYTGDVEPTCGEITIHTNVAGNADGSEPGDQRVGPYLLQRAFFEMVRDLLFDDDLLEFSERAVSIYEGFPEDPCAVGAGLPGECIQLPDSEFKKTVVAGVAGTYLGEMETAYNTMIGIGATFYDIPDELLARGWGGAAIWYNRIAEWNGGLFTAAINTPTPGKVPMIMENIQEERRSHDEAVDTENRYCPSVQGFRAVSLVQGRDLPIGKTLCEAYKYWFTDGKGLASDLQTSGNVFFDLLNSVFGIGGLFTMRENDDVHPLAQLSALGKSIIEASIRNLLSALVFSAGGGMGEIIGTHLGAAASAISGMFVAFTTVGLTIGFMLYYILPFMPFMYFFFAVGGWVKTIFEAMVGVPLWALAHLRVDGNGFSGDAASNGYFLIFEIFIRPVLTVFGLIAAMAIFSAMARTLNGVFDLVVENLTGFDCTDCNTVGAAGIEFKRNPIDEFFFTIIYTILVYMLATSSFKMIDQIPNSILRWMGAGVQSFGDQRDDPAQGMVQYAAFGGNQIAGQVTGALNQGAKAAGQGVGLPFGMLANRNAGNVSVVPGGAGNIGKGGGGGLSGMGNLPPKK